MNFIDISSWQIGLDLGRMFIANKDLDGVIVKSTGGSSYVQTTCDEWVTWLMRNGKPWGFYHYLNDDGRRASGSTEAAWWVKHTRNYFGKGMPFADYEGDALHLGTAYLKEFLDSVTDLTGVRPGVYCSLSVVQSQDFSAIAAAGYPLWLAQYATSEPQAGFVDKPWQRGSVAPFDGYIAQQYSGNGRLPGWNSALDLDKVFLTAEEWDRLAAGGQEPTPPAELKKADPEIVMRVLDDEFGIGEDRRQGLIRAGYDPDSVQAAVNTCYNLAWSVRKTVGVYMPYMECIARIAESL